MSPPTCLVKSLVGTSGRRQALRDSADERPYRERCCHFYQSAQTKCFLVTSQGCKATLIMTSPEKAAPKSDLSISWRCMPCSRGCPGPYQARDIETVSTHVCRLTERIGICSPLRLRSYLVVTKVKLTMFMFTNLLKLTGAHRELQTDGASLWVCAYSNNY